MSLALRHTPHRTGDGTPEAIRVAMPPDRVYRFSIRQYHDMIQAGILRQHDRVELLEGWVVAKVTHNPPHDCTIQLVDEGISPHLASGWTIRIQSAISLARSEPEPDLAVVRGPSRRYLKSHPVARDVGWLMEVADTTVAEDRDCKGPIYARALIPIYWIINISEAQIEVYTEPKGGRKPGYARRQDFRPGDEIPLILGGREFARVPVRDLLP